MTPKSVAEIERLRRRLAADCETTSPGPSRKALAA